MVEHEDRILKVITACTANQVQSAYEELYPPATDAEKEAAASKIQAGLVGEAARKESAILVKNAEESAILAFFSLNISLISP